MDKLIEDTAQAMGRCIRSIERNFPAISVVSVLSGKNLGALGDGGAIIRMMMQ